MDSSSSTPAGPLRIGLTGGIASGKSAAAALFAARGATVIDADLVSRELVAPGAPALAEIAARFGPAVLAADGGLDRAALRRRVFADEAERRALEAILHPRVRAELERRAATAAGPYVLLVVPLLVEAGMVGMVARVVVVDLSPERQRQRLMARDRLSASEAERILAAQASRAERLAHADDVLHNDDALAALERQVEELHRRYLALAV